MTGYRICTSCGMRQPLTNFGKEGRGKEGLRSKCKVCIAEYMRQYHKLHPAKKPAERNRKDVHNYIQRNRHKRQARQAISDAIEHGRMERADCQRCSAIKTEFHHTQGYDKENYLVGVWVCHDHHLEMHRELRNLSAESAG
jgi:hypothetical protein